MNPHGWGAGIGLMMGVGLLLIGSWLRARRPLSVAERIGPFVVGPSGRRVTVAAARTPVSAWTTIWLLTRPRRRRALTVSARDRDRLQQMTWGVLGAAVGAGTGVVLAVGGSSPLGVLVLGAAGAGVGALLQDRHRAAARRQRAARIDQQLPTVAELLAFAVAAGESPVAALERVVNTTSGDLADEVNAAIADVRSGVPLDAALVELGRRAGTPAATRFVEGIAVALERGTPLSEVMRAQAADCRADERRRLMELAGRKDVLMLVPVVFFILPTVVLVALYPGIQGLRMVVA